MNCEANTSFIKKSPINTTLTYLSCQTYYIKCVFTNQAYRAALAFVWSHVSDECKSNIHSLSAFVLLREYVALQLLTASPCSNLQLKSTRCHKLSQATVHSKITWPWLPFHNILNVLHPLIEQCEKTCYSTSALSGFDKSVTCALLKLEGEAGQSLL